jgi:hypothetical protein
VEQNHKGFQGPQRAVAPEEKEDKEEEEEEEDKRKKIKRKNKDSVID